MSEVKSEVKIESSWAQRLNPVFQQDYMKALSTFLKQERKAAKQIYPPSNQIFRAFDLTPWSQTGTWVIVFCSTYCAISTLTSKYF